MYTSPSGNILKFIKALKISTTKTMNSHKNVQLISIGYLNINILDKTNCTAFQLKLLNSHRFIQYINRSTQPISIDCIDYNFIKDYNQHHVLHNAVVIYFLIIDCYQFFLEINNSTTQRNKNKQIIIRDTLTIINYFCH